MRLVATLCIDLGWTRDTVLDEVTPSFLAALGRAYEDAPPLRLVVARFAGIKPAPKKGNLEELVAMFPGGKIR